MSIIFKITGLLLLYVFISIIIRKYQPEYVFLLRFFIIIFIVFLSFEYIEDFISSIIDTFDLFLIDSSHISLMMKVIGISILTDFISDTLNDNGETALSNIITILAKIIIILLSLPILNGVIAFCLKLIES